MLKTTTHEIFVGGPAGRLQALFDKQDLKRVALVFPPHSKYAGNMHNKVLGSLRKAFIKNGFSVLTMNYRGVGSSTGPASKKDDELFKDAAALLAWAQKYFSDPLELWLSGFSFGAWIALNLAMRRPEVTGFVAVATPNKTHDMSFMAPCTIPGLFIQGTEDKLSEWAEMAKIANASRGKVIDYLKIEGADYKYSNLTDLAAIEGYTGQYIEKLLSPIEDRMPAPVAEYA